MITKYLPKFKVMEVNNLAGLRIGHVLAQHQAATGIAKVQVGNTSFIENGIIVGLGSDGKIANYDATKHAQPFVHYTEEILTMLPGLEHFAVEPDEDGNYYPRAIGLYVGDAFTTNNYVKGAVTGDGFAKVVNGVLNLQAAADGDTLFIAKKGTMPNGEEGYEFTYCGKVVTTTATA